MKWLVGSLLAMGIAVALAVLSPSVLALDETGCLGCHSNTNLSKFTARGVKISLYVDQSHLDASAHRFIDCTTCHSQKPHDVETPLTKLSLAQKCGTCHAYQYEQHKESVHGRQLQLGNPDVATCVDCHSDDQTPHNVKRVLSYDAPAYPKNIAQTCGRCHGDPKLMEQYGIVEKIYESYMSTFHGKAMQLAPSVALAQLNKATCINCHGTHNIVRTDDPRSPVAGMENLAKTCEQCHPGAGQNFAASFLGHKETSLEHQPVVFVTERFFLIFTTGVLAFGFTTVGLDITRWLLNRRHRRHPWENL